MGDRRRIDVHDGAGGFVVAAWTTSAASRGGCARIARGGPGLKDGRMRAQGPSLALRASRVLPPALKGRLRRLALVRWIAERAYARIGLTTFPMGLGELLIEIDVENRVERGLVMGRHERYLAEWLWSVVQPGWTCLDIGAHIGWYTVQLACLVGPAGRVVAFEPIPVLRDRLRRNLELDKLSNVAVEGVALHARPGEGTLWVEEVGASGPGGRSSLVRRSFSGHELKVPMDTLDRWTARTKPLPIDLIKIDVEGVESEVLAGGRGTLRQFQPVVVVEFNEEGSRAEGWAILQSLGYRMRELGRAPSMIHDVGIPSGR